MEIEVDKFLQALRIWGRQPVAVQVGSALYAEHLPLVMGYAHCSSSRKGYFMRIAQDSVVTIEYTLTDPQGQILDSSVGEEPLVYLHGKKNIIPGLERELAGRQVGDELKVVVSPQDGYGERSDALVTQVPREDLAQIPDLSVGLQLQAQTARGVQVFTVVELNDEKVTLDGNHPLAGQTLNFAIKIMGIRPATQEELAHGHAHGPGGHHH